MNLVVNPTLQKLNIALPPKEQQVLWGEDLFHHPQSLILLKQLGRKFFFITDPSLANRFPEVVQFFQNMLQASILLFSFSEQRKDENTLWEIEKSLFENEITKDSVIIALGGGVIHDVVGFAASIILRGVSFVMIPTTLLAMCDASFGGKTALNAYQRKNAIGSFYPAQLLLQDSLFLSTLPKNLILEGMAEIIKCALIQDEAFFEEIEETFSKLPPSSFPPPSTLLEWAKRAAEIKMEIVQKDPFDKKERALLNFGHTFGHGLEIVTSYKVSHGRSVLWGIYFESALSLNLGYLSFSHWERIEKFLSCFLDFANLPYEINIEEEAEKFQKILLQDKKSKELPHFVLLKKIGEIAPFHNEITHPVTSKEIKSVLEKQKWVTV